MNKIFQNNFLYIAFAHEHEEKHEEKELVKTTPQDI
jgi:hypothetical protein